MSHLSGIPTSNALAIKLGKLQQRTDNPTPAEQAERRTLSLEINKAYRSEIRIAEDRGRRRPKHPLLIDVDDYILREGVYVHRDPRKRQQNAEADADSPTISGPIGTDRKNRSDFTTLPSFQRSEDSGSKKRKREKGDASSSGRGDRIVSTSDLRSNLAAGRAEPIHSSSTSDDAADKVPRSGASKVRQPVVGHPVTVDSSQQHSKLSLTERRRQKERITRNQQRRGVAVPVPKERRQGFRDLKDDNPAYKGPKGLVDLGMDEDDVVSDDSVDLTTPGTKPR